MYAIAKRPTPSPVALATSPVTPVMSTGTQGSDTVTRVRFR
jgi:hypothetical protein